MSRLKFDEKKPPAKLVHPVSAAFRAEVSQYEDDNTAVEAANKTSAAAETTVSVVSHERQTSKQRQSRAAHIGEEARHEAKNWQHENIKRQYAEKKRNAEKTGEDIRDLTEKAAEAVRKTKTYIAEHKKGFLITREDWDAIKAVIPLRDVEKRFMQNPEDGILIYQLKEDAPAALWFAGFDRLQDAPDADNYKAVYTQPLYDGGSKNEVLVQGH